MKKIIIIFILIFGVALNIYSQDEFQISKSQDGILANAFSKHIKANNIEGAVMLHLITTHLENSIRVALFNMIIVLPPNLNASTKTKINGIFNKKCPITIFTSENSTLKLTEEIENSSKSGWTSFSFDLSTEAKKKLVSTCIKAIEFRDLNGNLVLRMNVNVPTNTLFPNMIKAVAKKYGLKIGENVNYLVAKSSSSSLTHNTKGNINSANGNGNQNSKTKIVKSDKKVEQETKKKIYNFSKVIPKCSKYNCYEIPFTELQDCVFGILSQKMQTATIESVQAELLQVYNAKSEPFSPYNATALALSYYQDNDFYNVKILGKSVKYSYFNISYTGEKSISYNIEVYEKHNTYKQALSYIKTIQNKLEEIGYSFGKADENKNSYYIEGNNSMNKKVKLLCHSAKNNYYKYWSVSIEFTE